MTLGKIALPNRKRRTDVLERLTMGVRPLRHGHHHDHQELIYLSPFINLTRDCNGFEWCNECTCSLCGL
jgi:hypothetical protein